MTCLDTCASCCCICILPTSDFADISIQQLSACQGGRQAGRSGRRAERGERQAYGGVYTGPLRHFLFRFSIVYGVNYCACNKMSTQTTTEFSHCCAAHLQLDFHFHFHFHFHIAIFAWASHSQAGRQGVCLVVPVPDQTRGKSVFPGDADADACDKSASGHYISLLNKLRSAKMTPAAVAPSLSLPLSLSLFPCLCTMSAQYCLAATAGCGQ